jgi:hypothetical protein
MVLKAVSISAAAPPASLKAAFIFPAPAATAAVAADISVLIPATKVYIERAFVISSALKVPVKAIIAKVPTAEPIALPTVCQFFELFNVSEYSFYLAFNLSNSDVCSLIAVEFC